MISGRSPRVLIVEDNPGDVFLFQEGLREMEVNIELLVATEVDEGIRLLAPAHGPPPCLALIDLHLPKRDGKYLLAYLRVQAHLSGMPAVILSSSQRPVDRDACIKLGAHDVLVKPSDWNGYCSLIDDLARFWS
ncbi:MAG: response regulator [Planctomycetes bacterium]|nr:response regulator [Planctomycetota bacterium]